MNGPWLDVSRATSSSVFRTVDPIPGRVLHIRHSPLITITTHILRPTLRRPLSLHRTGLSFIRQSATTTLPIGQKPGTSYLNPSH